MVFLKIAGKLATWLLYILTVLAAYGGYVNPHISALPSILSLMLPYLAILTFCSAVFWAWRHCWITAITGGLAIMGCITPISSTFPLSAPVKEKHGQRTFSLLTYNIVHGQDQRPELQAQNRTLHWILKQDADIVILQECHGINSKELPSLTPQLRDSIFRAYPFYTTDTSTDRTLLSKFDFTTRYDIMANDPFRRLYYDIYTIDIYGHRLNIVAVHLTGYNLNKAERQVLTDIAHLKKYETGMQLLKGSVRFKMGDAFRQRSEVARGLRQLLDTLPNPVIVCGDFNDVPASWTYRTVIADDFHDAYTTTGFGPMITFNKHLMYFHIDQILYRGSLQALSVNKGDISSSDHFPLTARFAFTAPPAE